MTCRVLRQVEAELLSCMDVLYSRLESLLRVCVCCVCPYTLTDQEPHCMRRYSRMNSLLCVLCVPIHFDCS